MHYLQQHILRAITLEGPRRFAQMKPASIDGNLFTYHLRAVMKAGYVSNHKNAYILTAAGKRYADRVSLESFTERPQPKVVTMIVVKNKKGEYLLYRRKRVPLRNMVSFPYGKMHIGERLDEAAARELIEKTGLGAQVQLQGSVSICIYDEEELVSHFICHIFTASRTTGSLKNETKAGTCFWGTPATIPARFLMPGTKQILKLLASKKKNFFAEYFLDVHEVPFDSP